MSALPTVSAALLNKLKDTITCSICQDILTDPVIACTKQHIFDLHCLMHWVERKPTCPECREKLQSTFQTNRLAQMNIEIYQNGLKQEKETLEKRAQLATSTSVRLDGLPILNNVAPVISTNSTVALISSPPVTPATRSPIFDAVSQGNIESFKLLIQSGESVNQVDAAGNFPIFYAKTNAMVEFLLKAGAKIKRVPSQKNSEQNDRFFEAISSDNLVIAKELLENGLCNIEAWKEKFDTPLRLAMKKSTIMMMLLVRAGANIERLDYIKDGCGKNLEITPLFFLLTFNHKRCR